MKSSCNCTALSRSREKAQIVTDYIIWERFYDSVSSGPALESGVLGRGAVLLSAYCNTVLRTCDPNSRVIIQVIIYHHHTYIIQL